MDYAASFLARLPKRKRSIGLDRLTRRMERYLPAEQVKQVMDAYEFAAKAHEGQQRQSGEPYISHPVAVATLLAELKLDAQTLMAALLHDVIEDTGVPKEDIAGMFGEEVSSWSTGSASWTRSSSAAAQRRRRKASARCCSPWSATCVSSS